MVKNVGFSFTERYGPGGCGIWVWGVGTWWLGGCREGGGDLCSWKLIGFQDVKMAWFSLLSPFQALQKFPVIITAAHRNIRHGMDLVAEQTSSDKISLLLATEKQLTAREHGGIVMVVTEEIAPFKRKRKKLGKTFLLPPQFFWVHTGAGGGSRSSTPPEGQCYTPSLANPIREGVLGLGFEPGGRTAATWGWPLSGDAGLQSSPLAGFAAWRRRRLPAEWLPQLGLWLLILNGCFSYVCSDQGCIKQQQ